jgi:LmbE family N-acetylglucosaminyl deacetylase
MNPMNALDDLLRKGSEGGGALVVAAHPDDETIGAGILLSRLPGARVLHLTDGGSREELTAAMALAGVQPQNLLRIEGVPDQDAVSRLPRLTREIAVLLRQLRPNVVITHAYEGGHPDHDAAALAVRAAVQLLRRGRAPVIPDLVEMALHHARPGTNEVVFLEFLPPADGVMALELSPEERDLKERMLDCFSTQKEVLAQVRPPERELFRPAPRCDIGKPPHEGRLQYEIQGLPLDGARWRDLARDAVEELEMPGFRG